MNKEIEEILDKLKDKDWYEELDLTGTKWIELKQEETNLLLSYIEQLENNRDKAIGILGNYKHYSTPTEEQNRENEDIVDNAYNILKGGSDE